MNWIGNSALRPGGSRWLVGPAALLGLLAVAAFLVTHSRKSPVAQNTEAPPNAGADSLALGKQLYAGNCLPCHGELGRGDGPAARFLYPRPRNFSEGRFRLVSAVNLLPTDEDLLRVITDGMPGSAMFPFRHLSSDDRLALVAYVRHLTRAGLDERLRQEAAKSGEPVNPAELAESLDRLSIPGEVLTPPADWPAPSPESVARGLQTYNVRCLSCHGASGKAEGVQDQRNDDGMPTRPRDFTRGIFKSGRDPKRLAARVSLGMPGSPMPSSRELKPQEVGDLVNFVFSFSDPAAQAKAEHHRSRLVARHSTTPLPEEIPDEAWLPAAPLSVAMSPLWWRNYTEPELRVQALHDGHSLAIRLTWLDATRNDQVLRPQDFEDMAALQLVKRKPEPFLGMGTSEQPVDIWLWRASRASGSVVDANLHATYPHMAVDQYPFGDLKEFLTARAAGNPQADPSEDLSAGSLHAKGFGTATMRPRTSQLVRAVGRWANGQWTVILHRPLSVEPEGGLPLAAGEKLSIAFALWDGAANDRNGQKLVSIWHDLELE
jgi:mono/diheme cytochrome c family protein